MAITAKEVNELRKSTGAGMMDCKNALVEADGDFEKAIDILRKKGQKVAAKREDREASEGQVVAVTNDAGTKGAMVVVNCETDFVAKNEDFGKMVNTIAEAALTNDVNSIDELKALTYPGSSITIGEKITEQTGVIGEKIDLSGFAKVDAGTVVAYNHPGNKIASIVGLNKEGDFAGIGRDVAMQVAAMNPVALNKDSVSQDVIDREIEVGKEQAIQEGKPAEMAEKIAMGRLGKFFKENTLLEQAFIKDGKISVSQYLKQTDGDLTVTEFKRIALA